jgi:serine/threonine protein kinase
MDDLEKQFAEAVVARGALTAEQLQEAREAQDVVRGMGMNKRLDEILIDKKWISRELAEQLIKSIQPPADVSVADPDQSIPLETSESHVPARKPRLPGYEVQDQIGAGAMGQVYRARDIKLDRLVAIKVLQSNRATDKRSIERFQREARATAKLNHPNIIRGLEVGQIEGYHYFVMEFVEGETLLQKLRRDGPLDETQALQYLLDTSKALEHAHKHGIIHRDIKPSNLMVDRHGRIKLADLGLMRAVEDGGEALTLPGRVLGTPNYMSPEQATNSSKTDGRSDLFSLGASFYHLLTGRPPFAARRVVAILENVISANPQDPRDLRDDLSDFTANTILKMIEKDPQKRHQSCGELAVALEAHMRENKATVGAGAGAPPKRKRDTRPTRVEPTNPWPYDYASSLNEEPRDEAVGAQDPSHLQVLPTPTEIQQALRRRRTALLEAEARAGGAYDGSVGSLEYRKPPSRFLWWTLGLLLGLIVGVVVAGLTHPWDRVNWEELGLPQAREWFQASDTNPGPFDE